MTTFSVCKRFFLPLLVAFTLASPVLGQNTQADLARENEELKRQVRDLQRELDEAKGRIVRLERTIEQLEGQLANQGSTETPREEPEITIDESKPNASPRALHTALVESHAKAMDGIEMGRDRDRQRVAYMRALEKWVASAEREFKSQIEWHVRLKEWDIDKRTDNAQATVVMVDPVTDAEIGDPFVVFLEGSIVRRLVPVRDRGDLEQMVMTGVLVPHIRVNPDRMTKGAFDNPRFVAPYVEYAFEVQVRSMVPVEKPKEKPEAPKRSAAPKRS